MASRSHRPWYGFLYYLLGAQGSFLAWMIAVLGVFITWGEAMLFAFNLEPRERTVAEALEGEGRTWATVRGIEVDLAQLLTFERGGASRSLRDTVLIDHDAPAAKRLLATLEQVASLRAGLGAGGAALEGRSAVAKDLAQALLALREDLDAGRLLPPTALVVVADPDRPTNAGTEDLSGWAARGPAPPGEGAGPPGGAAGSSPELRDAGHPGPDPGPRPALEPEPEPEGAGRADGGPPAGGEPDTGSLARLVDAWQERLALQARRLDAAVRPDMARQGILTPLPPSRVAVYKGRYGIEVGALALVAGHRPSELAFGLFCASGFVLIFLIAGLFALRAPADLRAGAPPQADPDSQPASAIAGAPASPMDGGGAPGDDRGPAP